MTWLARLTVHYRIEAQADSHMIWLGSDYPRIATKIRDFLATG